LAVLLLLVLVLIPRSSGGPHRHAAHERLQGAGADDAVAARAAAQPALRSLFLLLILLILTSVVQSRILHYMLGVAVRGQITVALDPRYIRSIRIPAAHF